MTYATITIQNYFRMYEKLAGMTGTALTESEEFYRIYGLESVTHPDPSGISRHGGATPDLVRSAKTKDDYGYNLHLLLSDPEEGEGLPRPSSKRKDYPDIVYRSERSQAAERSSMRSFTFHVMGRPQLVGYFIGG